MSDKKQKGLAQTLVTALHFEEVVGDIFKANGYTALSDSDSDKVLRAKDADFIFQKGDGTFIVEAKFYRTVGSQIPILHRACNQLSAYVHFSHLENRQGILVISSILLDEDKKALQGRHGIQIFDRGDLRTLAAENIELLERLENLLEDPMTPTEKHSGVLEIEAIQQKTMIPDLSDNKGTEYCEKLKTLKPGKTNWAKYERLCFDIFQYLFGEHLNGWHKQKTTVDGLNRYDLVCRIKSSNNSFWNFLANDLSSRYVIIEFKNYKDKIKQGQVLTTEKYLLETALRKVAIICTRKGADTNAIKATQGAMREQGKLMIVIDDNFLCQMLKDKQTGNDPSDRLFDEADNFLLSLPR